MIYIVLLLSAILLSLTLIKEIKSRSQFKGYITQRVDISPQNKILFAKLQKEYLNNISTSDVAQLDSFITDYYYKRCSNEVIKNEDKK